MSEIRIALVEDNLPFAQALKTYFNLSGSAVRCVANYPTGEAALRGIRRNEPEVVLIDINLPGMSGIECVARLKTLCPSVLPLILTNCEDSALIFDALQAGAYGYLLKRTPSLEIVKAIQQVMDGGAPMSPQIARHVVGFFHRPAGAERLAALTERERGILDCLAKGRFYKEIAVELRISIDTVRFHIKNIYGKLHVRSRIEAIRHVPMSTSY